MASEWSGGVIKDGPDLLAMPNTTQIHANDAGDIIAPIGDVAIIVSFLGVVAWL